MRQKLLFVVVCLLLVASCTRDEETSLDSQNSSASFSFDDIIQDTTVWRNLSGEEKLKLCQIPDLILKNLSTADLAKICVEYPLYFEFVLTNDEEKAVADMIESFNGLKELSKRSDGVKEVMKIYSETAVLKTDKITDISESGTPLHLKYMERILTSDCFLEMLDNDGRESLSVIIEKKQQEKSENSKVYGKYSTGDMDNLVCKIQGQTKSMAPEAEDPSSYVYLTTPFNKTVEGFTRDELTHQEIYDITVAVLNNYSVVLIDSASTTYNCHSYAWNMSKGGPVCWVNATIFTTNDNISQYWTNDLYKTPMPTNSYGAWRVHYYNGDHSAFYSYPGGSTYVSKWGSGPLVRHAPTVVPSSYNGSYRTVYYLPGISGEDFVTLGNTYQYTVLPNMTYATYEWRVEDEDGGCSVVSSSGNTANILFTRGGTFQIYCDIYNSSNGLAYTAFFEPLNGGEK